MGSQRAWHDSATQQWNRDILIVQQPPLQIRMIVYKCIKHIKVLVTQSCPTLCKPMDCTPPGSTVHAISQARILEWVAISFSRGSSQPRDWTQVSCIAGRFFTVWATREAHKHVKSQLNKRKEACLVEDTPRIYIYKYTYIHIFGIYKYVLNEWLNNPLSFSSL